MIKQSSAPKKLANHPIKLAIVRSNYYQELTESMEKACIGELVKGGVSRKDIDTFEVPGSWELPLLVSKLAKQKKYDGIVVFGIIIKGETYHFELIANECARALMDISLVNDIPVIFEVLATYNLSQAKKRSTGQFNKGIEAAQTLLQIVI